MKPLVCVASLVFTGLPLLFGNTGAQTVTILHSFRGSDGQWTDDGLVQGSDGNFYGTTPSRSLQPTPGTLFRISPSGSFSNLHTFGTSTNDGAEPVGLVQGSDGNFYGVAQIGGTNSCHCGTVYRITPSGTLTTLYDFAGRPNDGDHPWSRLLLASDGNFYGTTFYGGTNDKGTLFRITPGGDYTNLHSFPGQPTDGQGPRDALVEGSDGNFYGTTYSGGTNGVGTVFQISPSGTLTNLHSFTGGADGQLPYTGLIQGSDGNFYGTTASGGIAYGTVYRISPAGVFTALYSFTGGADGWQPARLVQGSDGNFYGTTIYRGTNNGGTAFKITSQGSLTTLYSFPVSPTDGFDPYASLVQGSDGNFYGTTPYGGTGACQQGCGTVFQLSVPLNPPANQISGIQSLGSDVVIGIPSVAGETYQLQFTTDLATGNWLNVPCVSVTNSIGALLTLTNFCGALQPQGFYRFDITP